MPIHVTDSLIFRDLYGTPEMRAIFDDVHLVQCMNYLKATGLTLGLLINFGRPTTQVKRVVNNF